MWFVTIVSLVLLASSSADEEQDYKVQGKRVVEYASPNSQPSYVRASVPSADLSYKLSQASSQQKPTSYSPQVQYVSQPVVKYAPSGAQFSAYSAAAGQQQQEQDYDVPSKTAYSQAPSQSSHHTPYSPASDVSSFSYSSPSVKYNSLGFLHQVIGNAAQPSNPPQQYTATGAKTAFTAAPQHSPGPKFAYAVPEGSAYSSGAQFAPQTQQFAPQTQQFSSQPQQFAYAQPQQYLQPYAQGLQPYAQGLHPYAQGLHQGLQGQGVQLQGAHSQPAYTFVPSLNRFVSSGAYGR